MANLHYLALVVCFLISSLNNAVFAQSQKKLIRNQQVLPAAYLIQQYLPLLKDKRVAVCSNQTGVIGQTHLVDTLLKLKVKVQKVFAPEHGFRGTGDAGEKIKNQRDTKTGLKIVSLYGKHKKPTQKDFEDVDVVVFDIQDVGARFYTYISTLHYVMEACAEQNKTLLVLDRPNPNGFYVAGPVLKDKYKSFVGMHPVPIVHGMTIGEYSQMIKGEKWVKNASALQLIVINCKGYTHNTLYEMPIAPSPNLKTNTAIYLYPSLCLFEGTIVSVGRGTDKPFEIFGFPNATSGDFTFTPKSVLGATNPLYVNELCKGFDLSKFKEQLPEMLMQELNLNFLETAYKSYSDEPPFFNSFFNLLTGEERIMEWIKAGKDIKELPKLWENELNEFKKVRKKYVRYPDFEE